MDLRIKPTLNNILVQSAAQENKTASGLIIPDSAKKSPTIGEVIAVGPGKYSDAGELIPVGIKAGDTVIFSKYSGVDLEIGKGLTIMPENEIIAVLK